MPTERVEVGGRRHRDRLTPAQVRAIRRSGDAKKGGAKIQWKEIGRMYGISAASALMIHKRERWANIDD